MNFAPLEEVKRLITAEPRRIEMLDWISRNEYTPCGTVACIAGWLSILAIRNQLKISEASEDWVYEAHNGLEKSLSSSQSLANEMLEASEEETDKLFFTSRWPNSFYTQYTRAWPDPAMRAQVVCERIDHFIKTDGKE